MIQPSGTQAGMEDSYKAKHLRRSLRLVTLGAALFMVYHTAVTCPLLTDYFLSLGATEWHFGLLVGLPNAMLGLQLVGAYISNTVQRRKPLFMISFTAVPVIAQDTAEDAAEGGLNYEGIMNTSDSLAWSTSDSIDEMVVVPEKAPGVMGWFETTALGKSGAGKLFAAGGNFMIFILFAAIVALHHNRDEDAEAQLALYRPNHFFGGLFQQWHAALAAEAAVLSGRSDAHAKVAEAISATEHNPIATALSRRASALRDGTTQDFESIAADLVNLGCAYQAARTLTLAGGTAAERGAACLKSLGATET